MRRKRARILRDCTPSLLLLPWLVLGPVLPASAQGDITVSDIAIQSGFQGYYLGHFLRGRATVAADFDLDGRLDLYLGNPGDESVVLVNKLDATGAPSFNVAQVLVVGAFAWGAAAADYDNDGDYDLFVPCGGNEASAFNYLFKNMLLEEGALRFEDVTDEAGVKGVIPNGGSHPARAYYANAVWGDYDRDGDVDLFVNVNYDIAGAARPAVNGVKLPPSQDCSGTEAGTQPAAEDGPVVARNVLWRNDGDGTFTDVTEDVGLDATRFRPTRHSTFFDADNDGDIDLYENNYADFNVLWRNLLVESGAATFEDATARFSPPGEDLQYPYLSFVSCSADFNQDGFEDLIVLQRGLGEIGPYPDGHALFVNKGGNGFVNLAGQSGLNSLFPPDRGVMGSMVGDVNADGLPDVYVGNGAPEGGRADQLFLSDGTQGKPRFVDRTDLIDFPAHERQGIVYPPYPYRTHGTAFIDVDDDGVLEIAVNNGGPVSQPDSVREPNRLFKLQLPVPATYVKVRPVGDAVAVSKDAIGTRFALTVNRAGGTPWTVYRTLFGGSCFSAQNGFQVHFYVRDADTVEELRVRWPDGRLDVISGRRIPLNSSIVVERTGSAPLVFPDQPGS